MIGSQLATNTHINYYIIKQYLKLKIRKMEKPSRGNLFDDDSDEEQPPKKVESTPEVEEPAQEAKNEESEEEYKPTVEEPKVEEAPQVVEEV